MPQYPDYRLVNIWKDTPGLTAWWPLDDTVSTQSYSRALNVSGVGRNIVLNATPTSATSWTLNANWAYASNLFTHTTGSAATVTQALSTAVTNGKAYSITYTVSGMTAGTITVSLGASGTARSANGTYTESIVATGTTLTFTPSTTFDGSISAFSVTQVAIPAFQGDVTNLLADGDMEASGTSSWTAGNSATLAKNTSAPHTGTQNLRITRNGVNAPYAKQSILTIGNVYRVSGYMKSNGTATPSVQQNGFSSIIFTGTTSTSWQPFDAVFVAIATDIDFGSATTVGTNFVEFDDITVSLDTNLRQGELTQDGDMEAGGTSNWIAQNSATLTKDTTSPYTGTQNLRVARNGTNNPYAQQILLAVGKTYRITGYVRSDGSATPAIQNTGTTLFTGTTSTSWQFFDVIRIATATDIRLEAVTSVGTQYAEFDNISVTEVSPLVGLPTNGVSLGQFTGPNSHLPYAYSFDGTNDIVNLYSSDFNGLFNPSEGTFIAWARVNSNADWTDGVARYIAFLSAGSDRIDVNKPTATNRITFDYNAGGTNFSINLLNFTPIRYFQVAITWSKSSDQVKAFANGLQTGATQTGMGTWASNLGSTTTLIGGTATSGTNPWKGQINDVRLYNRALSPKEIYALYKQWWPFYMNK